MDPLLIKLARIQWHLSFIGSNSLGLLTSTVASWVVGRRTLALFPQFQVDLNPLFGLNLDFDSITARCFYALVPVVATLDPASST
ncbi:hypothetical protein B0H16DRAFT_1729806 [Mycena metata]|uniref:Uncharacterized protein n=1 Tax=Mycena metata TaxID=1033252 RepID=A0AAD7MYX3_9AGAR|nr:hypothetical protein B0H16DRAFT_1729806 [Mycena metata]